MITPFRIGFALSFLLAGCRTLTTGPAAARVGVPLLSVDEAVLVRPAPAAKPPALALPDRLTLPASYRLLMVDGQLALVRETDSQSLQGAPTSLRIVAGEITRGELAYQPALLPQELAAEVAANRESAARMDNALGSVMRRSRELSDQALEIQTQSKKLAQMFDAASARTKDLKASVGPERRLPAPSPVQDAPQADR